MERKKLGRSNIEVSPIGMGCWAIGGELILDGAPESYGDTDDKESIRALEQALDLGINLFDTAIAYGTGHSERLIGKAFKGKRDKVVIITKFAYIIDEEKKEITGEDYSPEGIRSACKDSLKRLDTDYIDVFLLHENEYPTKDAVAVRDTLEEMVTEGNIRNYGWSTDFTEGAAMFAKGPKCSVIEYDYNVFKGGNDPMVSLCEKEDLACLIRGPLASGLLTGKFNKDSVLPLNDIRGKNGPSWLDYFEDGKPVPKFVKALDATKEILTSEGRTMAQGAIAWLWAKSDGIIPLPGFKNSKQVKQNAKAMEYGPLTKAQADEVDSIIGALKL